jgi:hypothetical protein
VCEVREYYFGCREGDHGHHWHGPRGQAVKKDPVKLIDGVFAPRLPSGEEAPQGQCSLHRLGNQYSIVAYWDRSGDSRGASNSAFVVENSYATLDKILTLMRTVFPWVFERQSFELVPYREPELARERTTKEKYIGELGDLQSTHGKALRHVAHLQLLLTAAGVPEHVQALPGTDVSDCLRCGGLRGQHAMDCGYMRAT